MTVVTNDLEYVTAFWLHAITKEHLWIGEQIFRCVYDRKGSLPTYTNVHFSFTSLVHQVGWRHSSAHCCMCSLRAVPQWRQSQLPNCDPWELVCNSETKEYTPDSYSVHAGRQILAVVRKCALQPCLTSSSTVQIETTLSISNHQYSDISSSDSHYAHNSGQLEWLYPGIHPMHASRS